MSLNRYFFALQEKLKASDSMSDWISDFKKSDAPQFTGKSEEKRRQMAIAAKLGAERGQQNEASLVNYVTKGRIKMADDAGEPTYAARKKAAQMQQQVVDQKYIEKVMDGAKGGVRTNTGVTAEETVRDPVMAFASKAHEEWRSGWRNQNDGNSVPRVKKNSDGSEGDINVPFNKLHPDWQKENLAAGNAAKDAVTKHPNDIEKAAEHVHNKWMERNPKQDYNAAQHVPYSELPEDEKEKDRVHVRTMQNLMSTNEEIQDSGWKEPQTSAKPQNRAKNLARKAMKQAVQKVKDKKGFGPSPADKLSIRKNEEVELDEGKYGAFRVGPRRPKYPHVPPGDRDPRTGLPLGFSPPPNKDEPKDKKVKEEVELDELDQSTLTRYATRAKFSSDPKHREGAAKAQKKINKKSKDMQKEETEQVDEALRHEIAGAVGQFIGNKIDPVHGDILRAHGKEAYRQAAYHIRKTAKEVSDAVTALHDKLHKHLRTGGLATEEVELDESHFKVGDDVICKKSGMEGEVVKIDSKEEGKYYTVKQESGKLVKYAPEELKLEKEDEKEVKESAGVSKAKEEKFHTKLDKLVHKTFGHSPAEKKEKMQQEDNKAYRAQDKASKETTGMSLQQRSNMYDDIQKKLKDQEVEYRKQGILPPKNEEVEQIDELSKDTLKSYAGKVIDKTRTMPQGEKKQKHLIGLERSMDKMKKEETELEEDGKLKGGAKDPCWTGYKMVGTKKKGGREVPNCVPREGTEQNTFKALREKLNGNSNRS